MSMKELWRLDYYEPNGDHRELNDHALWVVLVGRGQAYLACHNLDIHESEAVCVGGNVVAAKTLLAAEIAKPQQWPSRWLGPQNLEVWDEVLKALNLVRIGKPMPVVAD